MCLHFLNLHFILIYFFSPVNMILSVFLSVFFFLIAKIPLIVITLKKVYNKILFKMMFYLSEVKR